VHIGQGAALRRDGFDMLAQRHFLGRVDRPVASAVRIRPRDASAASQQWHPETGPFMPADTYE